MCDDTVCVCEDEGGRVVSNQTLGCVMIQCVYVKMKGECCKQSNTWMCDDTVCACEDEGGRVVSNQALGCVMIQCVGVKMKGEGL